MAYGSRSSSNSHLTEDTGREIDSTLSGIATDVSLLATEATVATLATEATLQTIATEATLQTVATEATLQTIATEATVATLALGATQTDGSQKTQICSSNGRRIGAIANYRAQLTNDDGSEVELTGLVANNYYGLARSHFLHSAGSAASFRPRIYDTSSGTAGGIADIRYEDATLVANAIDNQFVSPIVFKADASGKVYLETGVDAGADNTVDYSIYLVYLGE